MERMLEDGHSAKEMPISFSELGCVLLDLQFVGDAGSIANARSALLRAASGPPINEVWMRDEPAGSAWDIEVEKIHSALTSVR